ncbi:MAG TPA: hypothetical protein VG895_05360 [Patescibacteria group bacterium]|nr:hypothetical protein [Patescibacteria group bacterium]
MKVNWLRVIKTLNLIFWFPIAIISLLFPIEEAVSYSKISYFFVGILIMLILLCGSFLINIFNIIFVILGNLYLVKFKKIINSNIYITFIAALLNLFLFIVLELTCNTNPVCYEEGSLISGSGIILFIFAGTIFWTLPFSYICNKVILRFSKNKFIS